MKTAISIPDTVFTSAEKLASRLGQSRSQLYTQAISNYLQRYSGDKITQKLNEVYSQEDSRLDPVLSNLQQRSLNTLNKDNW